MNIKVGFKNEGYKHIKGNVNNLYDKDIFFINAVKNSVCAFNLMIENDKTSVFSFKDASCYSVYPDMEIIRVDVKCQPLQFDISPVGLMKDDDQSMKADILLKKDYMYVSAYDPCQLFISAYIPADAQAGEYTGTVDIYRRKIFSSEERICSLSFYITLHNVTLPNPKDFSFHLDLWQHLSNIARKHEVNLFSDEHFNIIEGYVKTLSDLGQKAVTVIATDIPWSGQRGYMILDKPTDLFEYSMITTFKDNKGYTYDYSTMDRYMELCFKYGIDREIEIFGLTGIWMDEAFGYGNPSDFPDGLRIRYYDREENIFKYMNKKEDVSHFISSLHDHLKSKGLLDKVRIIADEPSDIEIYRKTLNEVKKAGPNFKFKTAINHAPFTFEFKDDISDLVPSLQCLINDYHILSEIKKDENKRVLWYVCCTPEAPNTFLRSPLCESRFICLYTLFTGLEGFLRWNYTVWPENPRKDLSYKYPYWSAGDMNFVYPSWSGKPLLSLRYMALKRGIEDYELIKKASQINPAIIDEIKNMIIGDNPPEKLDYKNPFYTFDYETYDKARMLAVNILKDATLI